MKELAIPELSLVVLIGASGSGKSSFARKHFQPTEVLSSDVCRGLVADDEDELAATEAAFDVLRFIAGKRLAAGRLTVIDATSVQSEARKPLLALAREHHCLPVAIVLDLSDELCHERNQARPNRNFGPHVVRQQSSQLRRSVRGLDREGFRRVHVLRSAEEVDAVTIVRQPLWNNLRHEHGPFDIIGDIHGCYAELRALLVKLGYLLEERDGAVACRHPEGRKAVFLGDLIDRGPKIVEVLRLVMSMVESGHALCVPGNHEAKLLRKLRGKDVKLSHGLQETVDQLAATSEEFRARVATFIDDLVSHYVLDDGKLVVVHAGLKQELQGRGSGAVREFCLYGETTGETDEYGLPVRYNWAAEYRGQAMVVYGHTPVPTPEWINRTICIDTGCVFGGALTALRYPERELIQVDAEETYYESIKPIFQEPKPRLDRLDEVLDIEDVSGKRILHTRIHHAVTLREERAIPALEVMSRFAIDPRWLIYLPPTMSPSETAKQGPYLEHPREALAYYRGQGLERVICEEKHMGSRAVLVVCRDEEVAERRFRYIGGEQGACYTRTGRAFFADLALERGLLGRVRAALAKADLWNELETDWLCLDAEIMPWSAKARELLRRQYATTAAAGLSSLSAAVRVLSETYGPEAAALRERFDTRRCAVQDFRDAYRRHCWRTKQLADYRLAPFHLLASEGKVHSDRQHPWHMSTLARLTAADPELFVATPHRVVELGNATAEAAAIAWWEELTSAGGEGMVVKPLDWIVRGKKGLVQPALKCRGREYLRLIYGPEYTAPEHLERLRARGLGIKRGLALREFALGLEALQRFVEREPLYRVHECVFGVLALESEPVDPRL
ncbi:MAG: polynucleotide kinase-phosphatase [Deltaproteobacteria bacterium]